MGWLASAAIVAALGGDVIDRIAVTVGNSVITESEILENIRLAAFLNGSKPDFALESRRNAADRLIEQALIRREIEATGYGGGSGPVKLGFATEAEYRKALADYGLSPERVQRHIDWQNTLISFIDARFRPGIQVTEEEARAYYKSEYLPAWAKSNTGAPPSFEAARSDIEETLLGQRANQALDRWIGQTRTQTRIRFRPEVFR